MKINPSVLATFCTFALISLASSSALAQPAKPERPNAAGTWKWRVSTQDGQSFESSVALKQDGEKLTGAYQGRGGEATIQEGSIKGNTVSFKVIRKRDDQPFTIKFEGKLDGDQIKGSIVLGDGDRAFDWLAKREATNTDPAGTWKWSMARQDGERIEATLKLKREGEKLSGSVSGDNWTVELENGRIQGAEIAFQVAHERDGQRILAKSKGKIAGDTIKGTVEFVVDGETRVRDWQAQRQ